MIKTERLEISFVSFALHTMSTCRPTDPNQDAEEPSETTGILKQTEDKPRLWVTVVLVPSVLLHHGGC